MKDVPFFTDLLDIFGFFVPGAFALLLTYPLVANWLGKHAEQPLITSLTGSKVLLLTVLATCAVTIGALARLPSWHIVRPAARQVVLDTPDMTLLEQLAREAVIDHFNLTAEKQNSEMIDTLILSVADETSKSADNERFNRWSLFSRNCTFIFVVMGFVYLGVAARALQAGGPAKRLSIAGLILIAISLVFWLNYADMYYKQGKWAYVQCIVALQRPPSRDVAAVSTRPATMPAGGAATSSP